MPDKVEQFRQEREQLNEIVLERNNLEMKRFFALDSATYRDGAAGQSAHRLLRRSIAG